MRLMVTEHQVEAISCPTCQHLPVAQFPAGVDAPAHYGPKMQALVVSLSLFQLLPMERIGEIVTDLWGCHLSKGTRATWIVEAARRLGPAMLTLKRLLLFRKLDHVDGTGGRVKGVLHWFYVNAPSWHRKRGREAMNEIGILPHDTGRAIHDRVSSGDHSSCAQSVCGAHL